MAIDARRTAARSSRRCQRDEAVGYARERHVSVTPAVERPRSGERSLIFCDHDILCPSSRALPLCALMGGGIVLGDDGDRDVS